jgi:serine/threonine protein kinase
MKNRSMFKDNMKNTYDPSMGNQPTRRPGDSDPPSTGDRPTIPAGGSGPVLGRIDRYELIEELGGGGFGVVYKARDVETGIEVAVKGLPPLVQQNREELDRIRDNFALVSRLHHPHIAAPLHLHRAQSVWYASESVKQRLRVLEDDYLFVMAYAPGVTLSKWRRQFPEGKVPVNLALEVCRQIAEALDYAHSQKVMHRDIKPSNVVVETLAEGRGLGGERKEVRGARGEGVVVARVLDFGLAAEIRSSMSRVSNETGDTSGTRPYMAPEQWAGRKQGPATDQYALAVLFYELVSGEVPFAPAFETGDPVVMRGAVMQEAPAILSDLSEPLNATLMRGLDKEIVQRFRSCGEFVEALCNSESYSSQTRIRRTVTSSHQRRLRSKITTRRNHVLLLLAVGLAATLVTGYWTYLSYQTNQAERKLLAAEQAAEIKYLHEQQMHLDNLRQGLDAALQRGELEQAESSLAEFEHMGGSDEVVSQMQLRLQDKEQELQLQEIVERANLARRDANTIADGPGIEALKRNIEQHWRNANQAERDRAWVDARQGYDAVLAEVGILQIADAARSAAEQAEFEARAAENSARQFSTEQIADLSFFQEALTNTERARDLFEAADFAAAEKAWETARENFQSSENWTILMRDYQTARSNFLKALASVDHNLLRQYAGEQWREVQTQAVLGEGSTNQPALGSEAYVKALEALNRAEAEAKSLSRPSIVFDVRADGQSVLGKVHEGEQTRESRYPMTLNHNHEYSFVIRYADENCNAKWQSHEITVLANWQGRKVERIDLVPMEAADTQRIGRQESDNIAPLSSEMHMQETSQLRLKWVEDVESSQSGRSRSLYLSPRVGLSMATGLIGVELQYKHGAVSGGYIPGGLACGARLYLHQSKSSWFTGACGFWRENSSGQSDEYNIGLLLGYRWRSKGGWELNLGAGITFFQNVWTMSGGTTDRDTTISPGAAIDISVGRAF